MPIITKSELTSTVTNRLSQYESIDSEYRKAFLDSRSGKEATIFLSHSHDDRQEVQKVIVFLRKLGISVYVDWMDDEMPAITSGTTAVKIKEKIKNNQKFILLATNKAINSKWCNWELGLGDAEKYLWGIALFPIAENSGDWEGSEYLQIYPRIERVRRSIYGNDYDWFVMFPDKTKVTLGAWLKHKS